MKFNDEKIKVKSLKELEKVIDSFEEDIVEVSTGDNDYFIVIDNDKAVETIQKYFKKNIAFKDNYNNYYINFQGVENSENNFDYLIEERLINKDNISLDDLCEYFNYGTGFTYRIINNNCKFKVEKIKLLLNGKNGYDNSQIWKCRKLNFNIIKEYFEINIIKEKGIIFSEKEKEKQLKTLKNLNWYLQEEEQLHINKIKKRIKQLIDTNKLSVSVKDCLDLSFNEENKNKLFQYLKLIIEREEKKEDWKQKDTNNIKKILDLKCYSKLEEEWEERKKDIRAFFNNIDPSKMHYSGLFFNTKDNKWTPLYKQHYLQEIFKELFFCKLSLEGINSDNTIYLIKDDEFFITEEEIWFEIVKHVSTKYDIELLQDTRKEIITRLKYLTSERTLTPCYKINNLAILENGDNVVFDKEKHLPFWSYNNYKEPTKKQIKDSDKLLLQYVSEEQLQKFKTMLSYFLIPGSSGKKLFFLYSKQSNSGKTTFLENFSKGLFKTNANELIKMGMNGTIDRMNEILTIDGEFYDYNSQLSKIIKKKTGEKVLNVKTMYENSKTLYNFNKYVSTTNKLPNLKGETALFDKIWVITFGEKEMKTDKDFFVKNVKKMKDLQNVIIHNVLTKKGEIIDKLLGNRNDKENDLLLETSNVFYEYCEITENKLDDIYYDNFIHWAEDYYGRKTFSKKYCKEQLEVLEKLGKKVDIKKFLYQQKPYIEPKEKIDISKFSIEKN